MKTIEQLILETENETKAIEDLALELFCKHEISLRLKHIADDEERLGTSKKRMDELTTDSLRERFDNDSSMCYSEGKRNKEYFSDIAKKQLD